MAFTNKEFAYAVATDAAVAIVVFVVFAIVRRLQFANRYYAPKRFLKTKYRRPKKLSFVFFSWLRQIFDYDQRDILEIAGMDAVMYLRVVSFGLRLFFILALWNLATVLPTNLTGNNVEVLLNGSNTATEDKSNYSLTDFDKMAITNLESGSYKFWVHVASAYFATFYTLRLLWKYHTEAVNLRIEYLATAKKGGESHTVLVTDIPGSLYGTMLDRALQVAPRCARNWIRSMLEDTKDMFSTSIQGIEGVARVVVTGNIKNESEENAIAEAESKTDVHPWKRALEKLDSMSFQDMVASEFREVYPEHEVECVRVVHDATHLYPAVTLYNTVKRELEDLVDDYTSKMIRGKKMKPKTVHIVPDFYGAWAREKYPTTIENKFVKVDKLEFLAARLEALKKHVEEKQEEALDHPVGSAFVTFRSRWTHVVASTSLQHHDECVWKVQPAPGPEEVFWPNVRWRSWERTVRTMLMWSLFGALCCTFMIPVAAVQALVQIDRLEHLPVVKDLLKITFFRSLVIAVLPGLVLKTFLMFLPKVITYMNKVEGMVSLSAIDFGVARKFFVFQVLTVFFGSFIAGSLFSEIKALIKDPKEIITILGNSAPQTASFFCTYILVQTFFHAPFSLLRFWSFALYCVKHFLAATERAKARLWQNQKSPYGGVTPHHTIVILLGIVFAAVNPIITLTGLAYFLVNVVTWRYQLLYVFNETYQSGGKLWVQVFDQILIALVIMQLMIIGLLGVKKFPYALIVAPLPFITVFFWIASEKLFKRPLSVLSLRGASDIDRSDKTAAVAHPLSTEEKNEADRLYLSPYFKINSAAFEELLTQVNTVGNVLKGNDVCLPKSTRGDEMLWSTEDDEGGSTVEAGDSLQAPLIP